jgi:hypothetical protein
MDFFVKNICLYLCDIISYHHVGDGLVVKALECCQWGCGLKLHFKHSLLKKKNLKFGD